MQAEEKQPNKQIDQAVVAFFDILGYSELVERLMKSLDAIRGIENALQETSVGFLGAMKSKLAFP